MNAFFYSQHRHEEMKLMASRPFAKVGLALTEPVQLETKKVGFISTFYVCCLWSFAEDYHPNYLAIYR